MAQEPARTDRAAARAGRRRRLVAILVVGIVLGGYVGWRVASGRALDDRAAEVTPALRDAWRPLDLGSLFESSARQAANPPASPGDLSPHVEGARWVRIRALGTDVFVAEDEIAVLARRRCLVVKAIGPVPNQVDVRALDGSC